jgi:hypothetical protein
MLTTEIIVLTLKRTLVNVTLCITTRVSFIFTHNAPIYVFINHAFAKMKPRSAIAAKQ